MLHSDQTGHTCQQCNKGIYRVETVEDEVHEVLHCSNCSWTVPKFKKVEQSQDSRLTLKS